MKPGWSVLAGIALALVAATPAGAVDPFEIQVYEGDINDPGQMGLELHNNYTASGRRAAAFTGEVVPDGLLRLTLEPSFALLSWWELGAYLQTATAVGDAAAHWAGFKLRSKFILPPARSTPFLLGVNLEVGRGVAALGTQTWDLEVRPIVAWHRGGFAAAINPIVGWALTGERHAAPELEPAAKVRAAVAQHVAVGVEYYASLGRASGLAAAAAQEHYLYAVGDLLNGPVELNLGIGHGLTAASEAWTIKMIVGHTF